MTGHLRDLNIFLGADVTRGIVHNAKARMQTCHTEIRELMPRIKEIHKLVKELMADAPDQ